MGCLSLLASADLVIQKVRQHQENAHLSSAALFEDGSKEAQLNGVAIDCGSHALTAQHETVYFFFEATIMRVIYPDSC